MVVDGEHESFVCLILSLDTLSRSLDTPLSHTRKVVALSALLLSFAVSTSLSLVHWNPVVECRRLFLCVCSFVVVAGVFFSLLFVIVVIAVVVAAAVAAVVVAVVVVLLLVVVVVVVRHPSRKSIMKFAQTTAAAALLSAAAVAPAGAYLVPGPWSDVTATPDERAAALVKNMTLDEKLEMLHGPPTGPCCQCTTSPSCAYVGNIAANERLGIPPVNMNDGPQGFRDNNHPGTTTAWPSGLTMAASFDVDALYEWGLGQGKEFYAKGANVQLGPGLCLARVPRNGRNFECVFFSFFLFLRALLACGTSHVLNKGALVSCAG